MEIHHLAIRTHDIEACAGFYRDVLGLVERQRAHHADGSLRALWLTIGPAVLMLEQATPGEPSPPPGSMELIAFAIGIDEREAWRDRLRSAGVRVEAETSFTLYFRDPEGRRIGLSCYRL